MAKNPKKTAKRQEKSARPDKSRDEKAPEVPPSGDRSAFEPSELGGASLYEGSVSPQTGGETYEMPVSDDISPGDDVNLRGSMAPPPDGSGSVGDDEEEPAAATFPDTSGTKHSGPFSTEFRREAAEKELRLDVEQEAQALSHIFQTAEGEFSLGIFRFKLDLWYLLSQYPVLSLALCCCHIRRIAEQTERIQYFFNL